MNKKTFIEGMLEVATKIHYINPQIRIGQVASNMLACCGLKFETDCFQDTSKTQAFLSEVYDKLYDTTQYYIIKSLTFCKLLQISNSEFKEYTIYNNSVSVVQGQVTEPTAFYIRGYTRINKETYDKLIVEIEELDAKLKEANGHWKDIGNILESIK